MTCTSAWFGGATCDHLYADCPSYQRGLPTMTRHGWGDLGGDGIDPHGGDVCGMCLHRHNRTTHPEPDQPDTEPDEPQEAMG